MDSLAEATEGLAVLCGQPPPAGDRVAVLSNAGGGGVLAVDACTRYGLRPATLTEATRSALAALLPPAASVTNPVDATATVPASTFRCAIEQLSLDPSVDVVFAVAVSTDAGDPLTDLGSMATGTPLVVVRLGQPVGVDRLATSGPSALAPAVFADPSVAARALSLAVRRSRWLAATDRPLPAPLGVDLAGRPADRRRRAGRAPGR
ncbi:hypothetical protein [Pseudonocardia acaciae]|uniref:hypothetical protein n=1 Tax=Pseudonocardia acaciae TaxID=551276 RepID=UPI0014705765|nr:hypothetical protein [Pseudonocardia acaciae]